MINKRFAESRRELLKRSRRNAKDKGVPFEIKLSDIIIPRYCPVFGIELKPQRGIRSKASPSLDRVIPVLGYVPGNVEVVSWRANRLKSDATLEEIAIIAAYYEKLELPLVFRGEEIE